MSARISFKARGHPNVSAAHKTTFELTKDDFLTEKGDCIVGIDSDFDVDELRAFAAVNRRVRIILRADGMEEVVHALVNPSFADDREFVVRMGNFASPRTFAVRADRSSMMFDRRFVRALKDGAVLEVEIEEAVE